MDSIDVSWLKPIPIPKPLGATVEETLKILRRAFREGFRNQGYDDSDLDRCVYVLRIIGDTVIDYDAGCSPVLYVGRGQAPKRIASHLKNWLSDAFKMGHESAIEIRICMPRRKNRPNYYKNIEAYLIHMHFKKYGCIPFFNSHRESSYENKLRYGPSQIKILSQSLGIGRGNRPKWAIRPMPSNPAYETYCRGWRV